MKDQSNRKDIWWIIATASSIVTLLGFFLGWHYIGDITHPSTAAIPPTKVSPVVNTQRPQPTVTHTSVISSASPTKILPTSTPFEPLPITNYGTYEGVEMKMIPSPNNSGVIIKINFPDSRDAVSDFVNTMAVHISAATKDIVGNWNAENYPPFYMLNKVIGNLIPLKPGEYALYYTMTGFNTGHRINGCDYPILYSRIDNVSLVFPVKENFTTEITYYPALLEIALLSKDGKKAYQGGEIDVNCQGKDVTGKPIWNNPISPQDYFTWGQVWAKLNGLAEIYLAPGIYMVQTTDINGHFVDKWDIQLSQGEVKRINLIYSNK